MGEISFSIRLKAWYKSMLKHCGLLKTKHVSENGRMVDGLSSGDTIIYNGSVISDSSLE